MDENKSKISFRDLSSEEEVKKLAEQFGIPFIDLRKVRGVPHLLKLIPEEAARRFCLFPFNERGDNLYIAMINPLDLNAINYVQFTTRKVITPYAGTKESIIACIERWYRDGKYEPIGEETIDIKKAEVSKISYTDLDKQLKDSSSTAFQSDELTKIESKQLRVQKDFDFSKQPVSVAEPAKLKKILVVEDDESVVVLIGTILKSMEVEVKMARDGIDALEVLDREKFDLIILDLMMPAYDGVDCLEKVEERKPDAIVLDVMMPRMDGFRTLREIRRRVDTKDIAIILLTARTSTEDKVKGLELGADDYITKPFSPEELRARIKAVFRRTSKLRRQL